MLNQISPLLLLLLLTVNPVQLANLSSLNFAQQTSSQLSFSNSSSICCRVTLFPNSFQPSLVLSSSSELLLSESTLETFHTAPFFSLGKIILNGIHVETEHIAFPMIVSDAPESLFPTSHLLLRQTSITNLIIDSSLTNGLFSIQTVTHCFFFQYFFSLFSTG